MTTRERSRGGGGRERAGGGGRQGVGGEVRMNIRREGDGKVPELGNI